MKKLRFLALSMALVLAVGSLAGCGNTPTSAPASGSTAASGSATASASAAPTTPADTSTLRVGINADIADLGPFSAGSNGRNSVILNLYEYLGDLDGVGGELKGIIMKDYTTTDNLTYDINIYDYVYDTAGNHITASDVVWCYKKLKEMGTNNNIRFVESIEQTGDYSVRLVINANFIGGFANVVKIVPIVSQKAYEASPDEMSTTPVGTTNYKVSEFVPGASVTFTKADKYWQTDATKIGRYSVANVETIVYKTIKEAAQMSIALETNDIDMGISMDATEAVRFMEGADRAKGFRVFEQVTNIGNQMYLSGAENGPFYNNQKLRQAVCYAIDKQGLVNAVLNGYGVTEYTFGGDSFSDFNPDWKNQDYYNYNIDTAKKLLAESGFNVASSKLRIMTDNTSQRNKVAQIVQAYLLQLGIQSEILQYDSALFNSYKNTPTEWDIMLDNTGSSDYLVSVWRGKFDSRSYTNGTCNGWKDEKLQSLLLSCLDPTKHTAADMDAFHQYFKEQAYGLGLFNHTVFTVAKDYVDNIIYDAKMFVYVPGVTFKK